MDSEQFVGAVKIAVRRASISGTLRQLEQPQGRTPPVELVETSQWFNTLSEHDKSMVAKIVTKAVDLSVFGFLSVLDGVQSIEDVEQGQLELFYVSETERTLLTDPNKEYLH